MTRRKVVTNAVAALATSAAANSLNAQNPRAQGAEDAFFLRLLASSNKSVEQVIQLPPANPGRRVGRGANVAALVAAYCAPESSYYRSVVLIHLMEKAAQAFVNAQNRDGTLDAGNLASPPDTAFVVEALTAALTVIRRSNDPLLSATAAALSKFLLGAGEPIATGGIHTPNHRWVVCSALARINSLFPSAKYVNRIDEWLDEGIDIDSDGHFSERSPNYARVTVDALVTMARLLNRPKLLEPVRKNLDLTLHCLHPDGEIETVASRRQDQNGSISIANFYLQYRYLAILDQNPAYAAVVRLIEGKQGEGLIEGANPVIYFMEDPVLRKPLPAGGTIPSDYAKLIPRSSLVRIRRGAVSASVYGGSDWPLGVASGLASNPTFFTLRKGQAVLESVRMSGQFFSLGVFRSEGLAADGNRYALRQHYDVPYYQPLPKNLRNPQGDYPLTPAKDGRFWSKLDFPRRPMSNIQSLDQRVTVTEKQGQFELEFNIAGHDRVPYTIELAFRSGGKLEGALQEVPSRDGKVLVLKEGLGLYRVGSDVIEFGPGQADHQSFNLSGHSYAAHGTALRTNGICVYITAFTPFRRVITIRAAETAL
jgi:hypothetical protein